MKAWVSGSAQPWTGPRPGPGHWHNVFSRAVNLLGRCDSKRSAFVRMRSTLLTSQS